ncbi:hypothetical protein GFS31_03780 [Leptolyngbya sp. BL0902]|uniref:hypothetical protein n=1 Tax=Leptolyngbya sp. BL0902 TaxID=1115757 RepID=UPI0018E7248A|nr:hypothetical protein [Leptolyngbya sp. BL0902]QQE63709.1 hypothetical protein GFS31_03780 [Leptolyngbya sp. BL0902]
MNSHDPHHGHGLHDSDCPQDPPAIPDAAPASEPSLGEMAVGGVDEADALQELSVIDAGMDAVVEANSTPTEATDAIDPLNSAPSTNAAWAVDPLAPESPRPESVMPESVTPELSNPDLADPGLPVPGLSVPEPSPRPNASGVPAAEVWTELDEAEPTALAEVTATDPRSMSAAAGETRGDEPDPSVLDAGSGPRREAEKPGRTGLPYDDWEPSEVPFQPKELGILDQLMIVLAEGTALWRRLLRQVRSWLPRTWQRNLSDELMTAIALGLLILWLVLWNPLGGQNPALEKVVEEPAISSPALSQGRDQGGDAVDLAGERESLGTSATEPTTEALEPSPDQSLIADIQDRVSTLSRSYAVGLIQSVEVNWPQQVLAVNVSQDWYGLGAETQDRIAQDIYGQTQGLALAILQLRDPDGVVVARNPVVGPSMVILKRHRPAEGDPLA